ncbi:MAG TPA: ABC transporter ATP-binding protein [Streptosporangiaceae bacterium]|nr:ABC transporter ATP-binding protein [Streptosporangiaceae bacterium]
MKRATAIAGTPTSIIPKRSDSAALAPDGPPSVQVTGVNFGYPGTDVILEGVDLTVAHGEILVLIGASGCGKSTLLNLVAGILTPTSGDIRSCGQPVSGLNRHVSYMTQKDTLLAWRNAVDNVALPLEIKGVSRRERHERARQALARVGIAPAAVGLRPHQLSGGMRSRLALGRLLLSDTDIILMDEPFAAVDALLRVRLQQLLLDVWQETRKTIIYVTHDLDEAITLGHRVVVMNRHPGRIAHDRPIPFPQPRDASRFRALPEARDIYVELLDALEGTMT